MEKTKINEKIESIPAFELKSIAVKQQLVNEGDTPSQEFAWVESDNFKAITEQGQPLPISVVGKHYKVVQFKEVFKPIMDNTPDEVDGDVQYHKGFALMDIFPKGDGYAILDDNRNEIGRIGLVCMNSVNRTSSIIIRFGVTYTDKYITLPRKLGYFKKNHMGNVSSLMFDFQRVISSVSTAWSAIYSKMNAMYVNEGNLKNYVEIFSLNDTTKNFLEHKIDITEHKTISLWQFCVEIISVISKKAYKTEIHRRKRLDALVQKIFEYKVLTSL